MNEVVRTVLRHSVLLLVLLIVQIGIGSMLSIGGITPDLVVLGVVYVGLVSGRLHASVAGFIAGLLLDLYSGDVIGISALAKTLAGFAAGFFHDPEQVEKITRGVRAVLATLLCVSIHNAIFLFAYLQSIDVHILGIIVMHGVGSTAYTSILGAVHPLIRARTARNVIIE